MHAQTPNHPPRVSRTVSLDSRVLDRIPSPHQLYASVPSPNVCTPGMGKSGGRKKKSGGNSAAATADRSSNPAASAAAAGPSPPNGVDPDSPVFLKRAHELKEEGNRLFQSRDYSAALDRYDAGLRLLPRSHPDRAVFHSNRAACLMQIRPVDHEAVAAECSLALQAQPRFPRALLRRARALEGLRRYDLALQDVHALLALDPSHGDALDLARPLRSTLGHQPDLSSSSNNLQQHHHSPRPSAAALFFSETFRS